MLDITAIIPTKDSHNNLKKCLSRLINFSQILVVDSYFNEENYKISLSHKAEYHVFNWNGIYPKKRNWTLENIQIKNKWVLFLDDDEFITNDFYNELKSKVGNDKIKGYWLKYNYYYNNKKLNFGIVPKKLALFQHKYGRYEKLNEDKWSRLDMEVHEQPIVAGNLSEFKKKIDHIDNLTYTSLLEKHYDYAKFEAKKLKNINFKNLKNYTLRQRIKYSLIKYRYFASFYFLLNYIFFLSFLDGKSGLEYSLIKFKYFRKIYEETKI